MNWRQVKGVGALEPERSLPGPRIDARRELIRRAAGLQVAISVPRDPQCVAEVVAALIRADVRRGAVLPVSRLPQLKYLPEVGDDFEPPELVDYDGGDDCDGIVRVWGAHLGDEVGCFRTPGGGFHLCLFLANGRPFDPCVGSGAPAAPAEFYLNAARAPIRGPVSLEEIARKLSEATPALDAVLRTLPAEEAAPLRTIRAETEGEAEARVMAALEPLRSVAPTASVEPAARMVLELRRRAGNTRTSVHEAAARVAAVEGPQQPAAAAVALVTTDDPQATEAVLSALSTPGGPGWGELAGASAALRALGFGPLPYEAQAPQPVQAPAFDYGFYRRFLDWQQRGETVAALMSADVGGCPGTCGVRERT